MINEKELRTGNWYTTARNIEVAVKGYDTVNKVVTVDPLDIEMDITSSTTSSVIFEDLFAIELTEEKLLQLGFIKQDSIAIHVVSDKGAIFEWDENSSQIVLQDCNKGSIGQPIKHLHQLQNMYYFLTGKELPIVRSAV